MYMYTISSDNVRYFFRQRTLLQITYAISPDNDATLWTFDLTVSSSGPNGFWVKDLGFGPNP